jgi:hypothetical protein
MKKYLFLLLLALTLATQSGWAQPVAGNPVTTISSLTICQNYTTIDVPVTVTDFAEVGNISFVLAYSHLEISSPSVVYVNPGISAWGTFEANMAVTDSITISAYNPDTEEPVTGLTLDDGDTLFILSFTVGTITDNTDITFFENSEGTSCELGGIGPDYDPFIDTPQNTYYIPGNIELIDLDPGAIAAAQFICEGDEAASLSSTENASGEGTIAYLWQKSTTGAASGFSDIEGETSSTLVPGALMVDTWFKRVAIATLNGESCDAESNVILVTVINFGPGTIGSDQNICEGSDVEELTGGAATGDGTFEYQWQVSTTSGTEGFSDIVDATEANYDPGTLTADTWFRREATASSGGSSCVENSNAIKVTVINFDPGVIAGSQTFCEGTDAEAFSSTSNASGDGTITLQWQISTTSGTEGFSDIEGATSATYDPGTLTADTWYRRKATATISSTSCTEYSNVLSVIVINLTPGVIGSGQYICEGSDVAALTSETDATGDGSVTFQWQLSTTSGTEGFSDIAGATSSTYDPGTRSADTWYRRATTATIGETGCTEYSNAIAVVVINFVPGAISDDQVTCQGELASELSSVTAASGDGTIEYQWQLSSTGESEGFSDIQNATAATYNPGTMSADSWYRREATASLGGTQCSEYTNVVYVAVIGITPGSIDNAQTICSGDDPAALSSIAAATGEGTVTYQWQSSTTNGSEGFLDIEDATSETYNPGVTTVDTWFRRQASTTVSETECVKYTNVVKITANALKTISGVFYYYNATGNQAMTEENITVKLYKTSDVTHETLLETIVTDETGYYEFTGLCPDCSYDIVAACTGTNIGAINTTDAAQTNYWGAHNSTIEKVRFFAGDVGTSGQNQDLSVNSTDAGRIQHYFVYGTQMDRKWTFWKAGTTISCNPACESYPTVNLPVGSNVTQNMLALCTGDFNRSFDPAGMKSASASLELVYNGNRQISSGQEFDLPVKMVNGSGVGAVSLILNFPADLLEVKDVVMPGAGGQLDWAVKGNELRIGWNSQVPLYLADNAELLTLRLATTSGFVTGTPVRITLAGDPLNEIADETFDVIGKAVLGIDEINGSALGIGDDQTGTIVAFTNFPNPVSTSTTFTYNLPENGSVILKISSLVGNSPVTLVNESQVAGNHEIKYDTHNLPEGLYIATLTVKSETKEFNRSIKLIKNK